MCRFGCEKHASHCLSFFKAAMEASVADIGGGGEDLEDEMLQRALMESMNQGPYSGGNSGNSNF